MGKNLVNKATIKNFKSKFKAIKQEYKHIMSIKKTLSSTEIKVKLNEVFINLHKLETENSFLLATNYSFYNLVYSLYYKIDKVKVKYYPVCGKAWTDID